MAHENKNMEEDLLIRHAQQGNSGAFEELTKRYFRSIFNFVHSKIKSREDAEEITQDVFISAWAHLAWYKPDNFSGWLYTIASNKCVSYIRKIKRRPPFGTLPEGIDIKDRQAKTPLEEAIKKEGLSLDKYYPRQKEIIELKSEGKTLKQISQITGCSLATVKRELKKVKESGANNE